MSRTTRGPRVIRPNGLRAADRTSRQRRVSRYRPSIGWYGSVAAPIATSSRFQVRRASSRRRISGMLTFTRIDWP